MHAKDHSLNSVLKEKQQWVIPVYQRHYAWRCGTDGQLPKLWDDIRDRALEVLAGKDVTPHFVGAIIYSEPSGQPFGTVSRRYLVDGQQRVSTFSLALCAIRELAQEHDLSSLANAINDYVYNPASDSMQDQDREIFKLWSSSFDRPHYHTIAERGIEGLRTDFGEHFYKNGNLIVGRSPRMLNAYWYLVQELQDFIEDQEAEGHTVAEVLDAALEGFLEGFQIVVVQLGPADDAQAIFASLNGNAEPLSAFDLIRNDIFHRASKMRENEDTLYEGEWSTLEQPFWKTEVKQGRLKRPRTDHLIAHTLVAENAREVSVGHLANEYRQFARERAFESIEAEIKSLLIYADAYAVLEQKPKGAPEARLARFLDIWDLSVFHPIVMWFAVQSLETGRKRQAYHAIESYILRRDICRLTRKNYNNVVPSLLKAAKSADDPVAAMVAQMKNATGENSRLPTDVQIAESMISRPIYNDDFTSKKLRYVFREIEMDERTNLDEKVFLAIDNLTIEHLMPKKWAAHWPLPNGVTVQHETEVDELVAAAFDENGPAPTAPLLSPETLEMRRRRSDCIDTFGNLTIITNSLNPSISNSAWVNKREALGRSLLAINREIAKRDTWNEQSISARSSELADRVNRVWAL